jgi:hypothetical protein
MYVGYELMVEEPEIVKELRKEEKLGRFGSQSRGYNEKLEKTDEMIPIEWLKIDEELDDMWFNIWKCL